MRVPNSSAIKKNAQMLTCFVLGGIVGAIVVLYMYGHLMNEIVLENRQLSINYTNLQEDFATLEKNIDELTKYQQNMTIKKIEVKILENGAEKEKIHAYSLVEAEVIDRLRRDLKFLINLPMQSVAETADAVKQVINSRNYEIQQQKIGVKLDTLVISSSITVQISIKKID